MSYHSHGYAIEYAPPLSNPSLFCDADTGAVYWARHTSPLPLRQREIKDHHGPFNCLIFIARDFGGGRLIMEGKDLVDKVMTVENYNAVQRANVEGAYDRASRQSSPAATAAFLTARLADYEHAAWEGDVKGLERLSEIVGINALLDSERIQKEIGHPDTALSVVQTAHYDTNQRQSRYKLSLDFLKANGALVASKLPPGQAAVAPSAAPAPVADNTFGVKWFP